MTNSKCSTWGGAAKNGPTKARHSVNALDWRKPTVWSSRVCQKNLQHIALGRFYAAVDFKARKPLGLRNDAAGAAFDGGFKIGVLAGVDTDVGNFKNHGARPYGVGEKDG